MKNKFENGRRPRQENHSQVEQDRNGQDGYESQRTQLYGDTPRNDGNFSQEEWEERGGIKPDRQSDNYDSRHSDSRHARVFNSNDGGGFNNQDQYGGNSEGGNRTQQRGTGWGFGRGWNEGDHNSQDSFSKTQGNRNHGHEYMIGYGNGNSAKDYAESRTERMDSHKGKGPKGYERSDERIQENISDQLSDDHQLDASEIEVKVEKGEVILTGRVSDRTAKRRAEDIAEAVSGVKHLENRIRVSSQSSIVEKSNVSGLTSDSKSETLLSGKERSTRK